MGGVTEVTHGVGLPQRAHLAVIPSSTKVEVVDLAHITPATADYTGGGLGQATHVLAHLEAVVGGHGCLAEASRSCPTGRQKLNWCFYNCDTN